MPCPLFEPRGRVISASKPNARLPLIFEFEGVCHSGGHAKDSVNGFRYCNQGYASGHCASFPAELPISAIRFDVTSKTPAELNILVIEEENHWPRAWTSFHFFIAEERLEPEIEDVCRRAQIFQFCRSYLEKFRCQ